MKPRSREDFAQFTGSTQWFRHAFNRAMIYTADVHFWAERGGAHWLIDAIAGHVGSPPFRKAAASDERIGLLHFWKLAVNQDHSAKLVAVPDSDEPSFIEQDIPYTDFPLDAVDIWAQHNSQGFTLFLPNEY